MAAKPLAAWTGSRRRRASATRLQGGPRMSNWKVAYAKGRRQVRVSPRGIVVVEDRLPDGQVRHTRVYPDGRHAQVVDSTPQKAWSAARKQAK